MARISRYYFVRNGAHLRPIRRRVSDTEVSRAPPGEFVILARVYSPNRVCDVVIIVVVVVTVAGWSGSPYAFGRATKTFARA